MCRALIRLGFEFVRQTGSHRQTIGAHQNVPLGSRGLGGA
ncbi:MAG: type II toxin-antitoxin system HicA family toxin [Verrucomicrobiota bacterium]